MSPTNAADLRPLYQIAADDLRDNPGQWQAYESKGHCVVLAGPGSGKTKTLTVKLARVLTEDVRPPRGVACITYSNECARELRRRLRTLGVEQRPNVFVGTVHSFCLLHILTPYAHLAGLDLPQPLTVVKKSEQEKVFAKALAQVVSADENPDHWTIKFSKYRRTYLDRDKPEWRTQDEQLAKLIEKYEGLLHGQGLIDFDDMMLAGARLVAGEDWVRTALKSRFPVLVVDEYQDLGRPLHRIVVHLANAGARLIAVGDPDQSIYGFTGADPRLLRRLADEPDVEKVTLKFNYRCGKDIVTASEVALGEARGYESKGSHRGLIDWHLCKDGLEHQAKFVCSELIPAALARKANRKIGDIAILYRTKHHGDVIAAAAAASGMKFTRNDANAPYPKTPLTRWLEECAAWCAGGWRVGTPSLSVLVRTWLRFRRSAATPTERHSLKREFVRTLLLTRTANMPLRKWLAAVGDGFLSSAFEAEPNLREEVESFEAIVKAAGTGGPLESTTIEGFAGQVGRPDHLNLITMHSSKGLEFEVVIMIGLDQGDLPTEQYKGRAPESRRLFYVGLTRAKDEFHMTYSGWCVTQKGVKRGWGASEYLLELQSKLGSGNGG